MKAPEEIVQFIDDMQRHMLRRPSMYARSPESLEEQMTMLESLRAFIVGDEVSSHSNYPAYCMQVGKSGAMSFTGRCRHEMWGQFCTFFKGYLAERGRLPHRKSSKPQRNSRPRRQ